jgi:hypothetical protein
MSGHNTNGIQLDGFQKCSSAGIWRGGFAREFNDLRNVQEEFQNTCAKQRLGLFIDGRIRQGVRRGFCAQAVQDFFEHGLLVGANGIFAGLGPIRDAGLAFNF